MKTISPVQLIDLLPEELPAMLKAFEFAAPIMARKPGAIKRMIDEGFLHTCKLVDTAVGIDSHMVCWHLSADGGFWLDVLLALNPNPLPHGVVIKTMEGFAIAKGANYIRWVTMRKGIVRWAHQAGYTPEAVILTKEL